MRSGVTPPIWKHHHVADTGEPGKALIRRDWVLMEEMWLHSRHNSPEADPCTDRVGPSALRVRTYLRPFVYVASAAWNSLHGSNCQKPGYILCKAWTGCCIPISVLLWFPSTSYRSPGSGNHRSEGGEPGPASVHPHRTAHPTGPCLPAASNYLQIEKTLRVIFSWLWIN